jgi:hypothetical protein
MHKPGFAAKLSHSMRMVQSCSFTHEEMYMLWKLLGFQKRFDALFDDGWVSLGIDDYTHLCTASDIA